MKTYSVETSTHTISEEKKDHCHIILPIEMNVAYDLFLHAYIIVFRKWHFFVCLVMTA